MIRKVLCCWPRSHCSAPAKAMVCSSTSIEVSAEECIEASKKETVLLIDNLSDQSACKKVIQVIHGSVRTFNNHHAMRDDVCACVLLSVNTSVPSQNASRPPQVSEVGDSYCPKSENPSHDVADPREEYQKHFPDTLKEVKESKSLPIPPKSSTLTSTKAQENEATIERDRTQLILERTPRVRQTCSTFVNIADYEDRRPSQLLAVKLMERERSRRLFWSIFCFRPRGSFVYFCSQLLVDAPKSDLRQAVENELVRQRSRLDQVVIGKCWQRNL